MTAASNPRDLPLEQLLNECRLEAFRGPGPGGQKRNKTSSAVRVVHVPTGLSATAGGSRSRETNRKRAVERLRMRLALELREAVNPSEFSPPPRFSALCVGGRLRIPARHPERFRAIGIVMDVLTATGGSVSEAAQLLRLTTGALARFLGAEDELLSRANRLRAAAGLKRLGGR